MPNSISSESPSRTTAAEWLLARITTSDRAAAILGDLTEMAATRGRLWFWFAYTRTLITLGWRTLVGFVIAFVSGTFLYRVVTGWLLNHRVHSLMHHGIYFRYYVHVQFFAFNLTMLMSQALFFVIPFVLIRFGLRNRLTLLACALFLIALPFYTLSFLLMEVSTILCALAIAAALLLPLWRRPLIVLAATCIPTVALRILRFLWTGGQIYGLHIFRWHVFFDYFWRFPIIFTLYRTTSFTLAAVVCLYLSRRLLQRRPSASDRTIA
jgi:hypothetical protein